MTFVIISSVLLLTVFINAQSNIENTPESYYIHSGSFLIKGLVEVRHDFGNVFSADLSKGQLRAIQVMGIKTEPVGIFTIVGVGDPCRNDKECDVGEYCDKTNAVRGMGECALIDDGDGEEEEPAPEPTRECYPGDQIPWGIERVYGNSDITSTSGGDGINVAVLDTGVMQSHLDLKDRIVACETTVTRFPPDRSNCEDGHGHGTHVAGTILADAGADEKGIYGVASEADLIAVKVCNRRGECYGDDIAAGIDYATTNNANIISMSLGGSSLDSQIKDAVDRAVEAGVLVIAAAGNSGPNLDTINYPGGFANVVSVAATDSNDEVPDFSSRGINADEFKEADRYLEVAAPGISILSTWNDGCYNTISGTSMATPHISGLAAKLWQGNAADTRTYLQSVAEDITQGQDAGEGYDPASGFGLPIVA